MTRTSPSPFLACQDCDLLFAATEVDEGERIICPRCGANILTRRRNFVGHAVALSIAATVFFLLANVFPFMTLRSDYRESDMHLAGSVTGLEQQGYPVLAGMVGLFMLGAPALFLGAMLYVLVPLLKDRRLQGARHIGRMMYEAKQWNMVEVYLLGVLVSLLKLGKLATLTLGISFWAFVGLIVCLAGAVTVIDHSELWKRLEEAQP